jgi:hypothetical protein
MNTSAKPENQGENRKKTGASLLAPALSGPAQAR